LESEAEAVIWKSESRGRGVFCFVVFLVEEVDDDGVTDDGVTDDGVTDDGVTDDDDGGGIENEEAEGIDDLVDDVSIFVYQKKNVSKSFLRIRSV